MKKFLTSCVLTMLMGFDADAQGVLFMGYNYTETTDDW
jgi:hypothetical protein